MCDNAIDTCAFVSDYVPDCYKTQEMCNKVLSEEYFILKCCPDGYQPMKCVKKLLILFCSIEICY